MKIRKRLESNKRSRDVLPGTNRRRLAVGTITCPYSRAWVNEGGARKHTHTCTHTHVHTHKHTHSRKTSGYNSSYMKHILTLLISSKHVTKLLWMFPDRNSPGNTHSRASQLGQSRWTDPGLKRGISVHQLIKVQVGNEQGRKKPPPPFKHTDYANSMWIKLKMLKNKDHYVFF